MRYFFGGVAALFLSSCGPIQDELFEPGGYLGSSANELFDAVTPQQRMDRYLLVAGILAPAALETAIDEEDAKATIARVNALYFSLARMQWAINCHQRNLTDDEGEELTPQERENRGLRFRVVCDELQTGQDAWTQLESDYPQNTYAFEHLTFEVQQDLYFIARSVVTNLDLETRVEDLLKLNVISLIQLWNKVDELIPMFRETAARFRDGIILYADIVAASCSGGPATDCGRLGTYLSNRYRNTGSRRPTFEERELRVVLRWANSAFTATNWNLRPAQYAAIIAQIDRSCAIAQSRRAPPEPGEQAQSPVGCGFDPNPNAKPPTSAARNRLIEALRSNGEISSIPRSQNAEGASGQSTAQLPETGAEADRTEKTE